MNSDRDKAPMLRPGQLTSAKDNRLQSIERTLELLCQKPRVFQFPDYSIGKLFLRTKDPRKDYLSCWPHNYFISDAELVLDAIGAVTIPGNHMVFLRVDALDQDTLKYLSLLPANALDGLCFCDHSLLTNELEFIENLQALRILCLDDTSITDESFQHIKVFPNLEMLIIPYYNLAPEAFQAVRHLSQLQYFVLSGNVYTGDNEPPCLFVDDDCGFDDSCLDALASLENLREIHLEATNLTNQGLAPLSKLKHLHFLSIFNITESLSDDCTETLREITTLSKLYLCNVKLTDKAVESLALLKNLTHLTLKATEISKEAASWLYGRLPHCVYLSCSDEIFQSKKSS